MTKESEDPHDIPVTLGCLFAALDNLLCEVLFILFGFQLLLKCGK